ncbi:NAD(+) diphosphatase [Deinococcus koreensis]|uniref:NAD-capped RNA hydrolase NudC n=1 Tax=Deinococcus koreensis TaxID=2054903 RepID=A0A2K3UTT9_9DEIO|nr:NAD(+) diphosphatase [Deinococcus koreensis]PNY79952.1 NAD(+) diphosphatase [Deinococcus koreensis]
MSGRATSTPKGFVRSSNAAGNDQLIFYFSGSRLLLTTENKLPTGKSPIPWECEILTLGNLNGRTVCVGVPTDRTWKYVPKSVPFHLEKWHSILQPEGWKTLSMREALGVLSEKEFGLAGYAYQIAEFNLTNRFCGRCGQQTRHASSELSRTCPECGLTVYPRVAPVVMVLIGRGRGAGRELLLARGPQFPPGMYSALAGFVEPSETLETACHREVLEEVGVRITDLRYDHSQPWPFPHSLMIGFTAEHAGGEIVPQPGEIEDAAWFPVTALPPLPPAFSIARRLIDEAVSRALDATASAGPSSGP